MNQQNPNQRDWINFARQVDHSDDGEMAEAFVEALVESHVLAEEPEFVDFVFDYEQSVSVSRKIVQQYFAKLAKAKKKSPRAAEIVEDNIKIETIDALLTPALRANLASRLDHLVNRLQKSFKSQDAEKYMIATAVQAAFGMHGFPWGASSLTISLLHRSLHSKQFDLHARLQEALGEELTDDDLTRLLDDPDALAALQDRLDPDSELYRMLSQNAKDVADQFMEDVWDGELAIELFEPDEIFDFFERLELRWGTAGLSEDTDKSDELSQLFIKIIDDYLEEILTPDRIDQIEIDLKQIVDDFYARHHIYSLLIEAELENLRTENPLDNSFIRSVFASQMYEAHRNISEAHDGESRPAKTKTRRGRRGRARKKR